MAKYDANLQLEPSHGPSGNGLRLMHEEDVLTIVRHLAVVCVKSCQAKRVSLKDCNWVREQW
jgi:hypothetical protein